MSELVITEIDNQKFVNFKTNIHNKNAIDKSANYGHLARKEMHLRDKIHFI